MTVVYLIQSYKNPKQISRLVRILRELSGNAFILLSHDCSGCDLNSEDLDRLSNVAVIYTKSKALRGRFSLVDAYLDAINWLFIQGINFDWLCNLSGQDYPIKPLLVAEKFLCDTHYDGFIEYFDALSEENNPWGPSEGKSRYLFQYRWLTTDLSKWERALLSPARYLTNHIQSKYYVNCSYGLGIGVCSNTSQFNNTFRCYGGSDFKTLSRKCIEYIFQFINHNSSFVNYYRKTLLPEESIIQTILVNSGRFELANDNLRFIRWGKTLHGHPDLLCSADYDAILDSNSHFARKFDINKDETILDLIDGEILRT